MASKQFAHLQEASRQRLQAMIPSGCPLRVERVELFGRGAFKAITLDDRDCQVGRFEVVAAYITGFVTAWTRVRPVTLTDAVRGDAPAPVKERP